ncbi:trigger factor [Carboxydothermus pertinax]|uniref:Trigger factor n=1 Tax=Carboxydothermus pertinax TaxID=870242 RepID=A0A1L8CRW7_9THEO|nr:trigger factor [Carboxydothermus pertinax]GAV21653.1 trigger factor [Carboxydothermus pertinax]
MKVTKEKLEKSRVELTVEVEAEEVAKAYEKAYKKIAQKVVIPGFRKGKAPRVLVERQVGQGYILEEALDALLPESYVKAIEEAAIEPVDKPEVSLVSYGVNEPLVYKAVVDVKPDVELGQYTGLEVTKMPVEVTEEEVEKELTYLQNRYAKLVTVEDGEAKLGDMVVIDFAGKIDGEPLEGGSAEDYRLELGSNVFIPGFEEQIVGMKPGETREINVTFPEDYHKKDIAGKPAVFNVTLKEIKRKEVAPLDDEFAKDVSEFSTLEELKEDLKKKIAQSKENIAREKMESDLIEKAVDNAAVEIPESLVNHEVDHILHYFEEELKYERLTLEQYLEYQKKTLEELKEELKPRAERNVKTELVLEAIAKKEGITASSEELEQELSKIAELYQQPVEEIKKLFTGRMDDLSYSIVRRKTINFLVENAKTV